MRVQERTRISLGFPFSFIASYMYVRLKESTALRSFFSPSSLGFPPAACCGDCCVGGDSSLNMNSSMNLSVASTSGVPPPPASKTLAPCCLFRSPSSLNRFRKGGECTSSCDTEFAKHIFLVSTSPRTLRHGRMVLPFEQEGGMLLRRGRDSTLGKD